MLFFTRLIAPTTLSIYRAALTVGHTVSCVRETVCYYRLTMVYLSEVSRDGKHARPPYHGVSGPHVFLTDLGTALLTQEREGHGTLTARSAMLYSYWIGRIVLLIWINVLISLLVAIILLDRYSSLFISV